MVLGAGTPFPPQLPRLPRAVLSYGGSVPLWGPVSSSASGRLWHAGKWGRGFALKTPAPFPRLTCSKGPTVCPARAVSKRPFAGWGQKAPFSSWSATVGGGQVTAGTRPVPHGLVHVHSWDSPQPHGLVPVVSCLQNCGEGVGSQQAPLSRDPLCLQPLACSQERQPLHCRRGSSLS